MLTYPYTHIRIVSFLRLGGRRRDKMNIGNGIYYADCDFGEKRHETNILGKLNIMQVIGDELGEVLRSSSIYKIRFT